MMIVGFTGLAWINTIGNEIMTYGGRLKKILEQLPQEKSGPTLAQNAEKCSKVMRRKKIDYAMSAEEKKFRNCVMNGNRSCLTWNNNLLDGAFPPLNRNMKD